MIGGVASTSVVDASASCPPCWLQLEVSSCTTVGSVPTFLTVIAATPCVADRVTRTGLTVNDPACAVQMNAPKRARPHGRARPDIPWIFMEEG